MNFEVERLAAGMTLQLEQLRRARESGMPRCGWKVGINVPEVQRRLGLSHSAVGWLEGRRLSFSGASVAAPPHARLHAEAEVAIKLGRAVPRDATIETARECIESICPAIELVDYSRPASDLHSILEHSMFHFAAVIGEPQPICTVVGLGSLWPRFEVGGRAVGPVRDDLVPEDPARLIAFVARYLERFGHALEAEDLVLSGSFTAQAAPLQSGEEAVADFGPLGRVSVERSEAAAR